MGQVLLLGLVFLGTIGVLVGTYVFINRRVLATSDAALERLRDAESAPQQSIRSILRQVSVSDVPALDRLLTGRGVTHYVQQLITNAAADITPGSFLIITAIAAVVGFILAQAWLHRFPFSVLGLLLVGVLPFLWLRRKRAKRISQFQDQLPDAIDMLVSAMRAGYSFQAAMKFIGEEVTDPLGPEFLRFYEEQRLGMEVRLALMALQARVDSIDLKMFVTAILIQRETGGNLAEVLDNISTLMRGRAALKGEIESLVAESKLSARILGSLPFVVTGAIMLINPAFMKPLLESDAGPWVFLSAAISVGIGYWMMMSIANIDI